MPKFSHHKESDKESLKGSQIKLLGGIEGLREEIVALEATSREIAARLQRARTLLSSLEEFVDTAPTSDLGSTAPMDVVASPVSEGVETQTVATETEIIRPRSNADLVIDVSRQLLVEAGRPMERGEILEAFLARGYSLEVKNPPKFIGKTLWASSDFVHVDKRGYWITGAEVPPEN